MEPRDAGQCPHSFASVYHARSAPGTRFVADRAVEPCSQRFSSPRNSPLHTEPCPRVAAAPCYTNLWTALAQVAQSSLIEVLLLLPEFTVVAPRTPPPPIIATHRRWGSFLRLP